MSRIAHQSACKCRRSKTYSEQLIICLLGCFRTNGFDLQWCEAGPSTSRKVDLLSGKGRRRCHWSLTFCFRFGPRADGLRSLALGIRGRILQCPFLVCCHAVEGPFNQVETRMSAQRTGYCIWKARRGRPMTKLVLIPTRCERVELCRTVTARVRAKISATAQIWICRPRSGIDACQTRHASRRALPVFPLVFHVPLVALALG